MTTVDLDRLSPRQRTCLSKVAEHVSPKQIATELGISENTVRGYLAEAISILGAANLRDAARLFIEASEPPRRILGDQILRVADSTTHEPLIVPEAVTEPANPHPNEGAGSFHLLRGTHSENVLSGPQRILWVLAASVFMVVLLASSAFALEMLTKLALLLKG